VSERAENFYNGNIFSEGFARRVKEKEREELRKHLYRLKEQGMDLVEIEEKQFERYIDTVEVAEDVFGVDGIDIKKISICNETNAPFEVVIEYSNGSRDVFVNHPAKIKYRLREIKLPDKEPK